MEVQILVGKGLRSETQIVIRLLSNYVTVILLSNRSYWEREIEFGDVLESELMGSLILCLIKCNLLSCMEMLLRTS